MKKCGVYKITNIINNKVYVGSSIDISRRWRDHENELKRRAHHNTHLQRSYNKHGVDAFIYTIIEEANKKSLLRQEQYWMDKLRVYDLGYNLVPNAAGGSDRKYEGCKVKGCDGSHKAKSLCNKHYRRLKNNGDTSDDCLKQLPPIKNRGCKIKDCDNPHIGKSLCHKHYQKASYNKKKGLKNQWSKLLD